MALTIQVEDFSNIDFKSFTLPMITVYKNPRDFKDKYVARIFDIQNGQPVAQPYALITDTLQDIHSVIPTGLVRMERDPGDDPSILETWL